MPKKNKDIFPIVGIGASAGGLEAFEQFFRKVPEDSGCAYVVIQHLDPTHKGMLPELLQRVSDMQVMQAKDRMKVKPNCVYVIPPNKSMSILKGTLHLFEPLESRGLRLPIDFFFLSLAEDMGELSVGIILSGMGSDGTSGLQAIKEKNGIALVQEPTTAKFDSMPRHAIDNTNIDAVAPPGELPEKLMNIFRQECLPVAPYKMVEKNQSVLEKIIILLRAHTGNDFSLYKKNTMYRRIERRIGVHKFDNIASYLAFLQENPKELDILFKELLIGVTSFFRDVNVWEKLENSIFPEAFSRFPDGSTVRAWVPGCSTGEEAYTLAIVFLEAQKTIKYSKNISLQVFASDLDNDAIEKARKGLFSANIANDVPSELLNRYFVKTETGYEIIKSIREMVIFANHNLILHPPFINIDFISCRNLLIYIDSELQKKIIGLFFYALNENGVLILGSSETIGTPNHNFKPLDTRLKIYSRSVEGTKFEFLNFPSFNPKVKTMTPDQNVPNIQSGNIQTLTEQLILQNFTPAGVLVNDSGDILHINGSTGKYLEPAAGKANMNIFTMLREGLRHEFLFAFNRAIKEKSSVVLRNLKTKFSTQVISVDMHIQYIDKPEALKGTVLIIFSNVHESEPTSTSAKISKTKGKINAREAELEKKLQHSVEEMHSSMEEMQTTQEELKSTNEELQSANEELQSANEELTSSREEMQSLNEELQTLNAELQVKVDDYSRVDNDMKNLLNSTDIATLFLDKNLNIRRYTNQATNIFKFIKSDIGRPFTDQVSDLDYPEMASDSKEVLRTLVFIQKQVPSKDGRWFSVRIMPYRTYDDRIDGLVITFINITEQKLVEEKLKLLSHA